MTGTTKVLVERPMIVTIPGDTTADEAAQMVRDWLAGLRRTGIDWQFAFGAPGPVAVKVGGQIEEVGK